MVEAIKIAKVNDLEEGQGKVIEVNGECIALFKSDGQFYAIENTCPHRGGPLGDGVLDGNAVTCPWHAWQFDLKTGISPVNPAAKIKTFKVKVEGEDIKVEI